MKDIYFDMSNYDGEVGARGQKLKESTRNK